MHLQRTLNSCLSFFLQECICLALQNNLLPLAHRHLNKEFEKRNPNIELSHLLSICALDPGVGANVIIHTFRGQQMTEVIGAGWGVDAFLKFFIYYMHVHCTSPASLLNKCSCFKAFATYLPTYAGPHKIKHAYRYYRSSWRCSRQYWVHFASIVSFGYILQVLQVLGSFACISCIASFLLLNILAFHKIFWAAHCNWSQWMHCIVPHCKDQTIDC